MVHPGSPASAACAVTALLAAACGPSGPPAPSLCDPGGLDPTAPVTEAREVLAGEGDRAAFVPWTDGGAAPLVFGFQGGIMVTPVLRVDAPGEAGGDEPCWLVTIDNRIDGGAAVDDHAGAHPFRVAPDGFAYSDRIADFLSNDETGFAGVHLALGVTVRGPGFEARRTVTVTLPP